MISKIASVCLVLAVASAGHISYNGHGHGSSGQAVSSQKIVQDFTPSHEHYHHLGDIHHNSLEEFQHIDLHNHHDLHQHDHQSSHPKYTFEYSVNDPETQDQKSQRESRDGDVVEGEYSLLQPDGKTRTVTYKADKENGFQAQVSTTGDENSHLAQHHIGQHHFGQHHDFHGLDLSHQHQDIHDFSHQHQDIHGLDFSHHQHY